MSNRFSDCTVVVAVVVAVVWLMSPPAAGQAPPAPAAGCPGAVRAVSSMRVSKGEDVSSATYSRRQAGHARVLAWSRAQRD